MQYGFYFDQSRCIGCYTCVAACRSWHQLEQAMPDLIEIVKQEGGEFPHPYLRHLFLTCFHCAEPACVPACPEGLLVKRAEDGIVAVTRPEQCTGCRLCADACPYGAPRVVGGATPILKCNLCTDLIKEGKAPVCVAACPTEALDAGPIDELARKYGDRRELEGFDYRRTRPSIIFRAMKRQ